MRKILQGLKRLICDKQGASAVEYAVLIALIALVIILSVQSLGNTLSSTFANADLAISSGAGGGGGTPPGGGDDDDGGGGGDDDDDDD